HEDNLCPIFKLLSSVCRFTFPIFAFFFFQAEDGIRDRNVTGVQTCALPISTSCKRRRPAVDLPKCVFHRRAILDAWLAASSPPEIGRASCRERVYISGVTGSIKKKMVDRLDVVCTILGISSTVSVS